MLPLARQRGYNSIDKVLCVLIPHPHSATMMFLTVDLYLYQPKLAHAHTHVHHSHTHMHTCMQTLYPPHTPWSIVADNNCSTVTVSEGIVLD